MGGRTTNPWGKRPARTQTDGFAARDLLGLVRGAFTTGLLAACGETHVSAEAGQFSRWGRGARLTRRVREEPPPGELARVYFDRNAERSEAEWFSRDGSPVEPPPGELGHVGFATGC